jgi:hypothetical protein
MFSEALDGFKKLRQTATVKPLQQQAAEANENSP